jgi:low temperature requirement protein LtrA
MRERELEVEQRVLPLELFFDLVFVFAITQVTGYLADNPTWDGLLRGLFLLGALWWAWASYAWLTNTLNPEEGVVRIAMFASMGAMLIVSLAVPHAFEADGIVFGIGYFAVRALHLVLYALAGRGHPELLSAVLRITPSALIGASMIVVAGFLDDPMQLVVWAVALTIDYFWLLVTSMEGWTVSPEHFVERHGLIVIIALGESIVAIGVGATGLPLDAQTITAALLGIVVACALWWSYFDWAIYVAQAQLMDATGVRRAVMARDMFSYLHLPMVAGIVLFAFGLKTTLSHVDEHLEIVPAVGLCGGLALYFAAHVGLRLRMRGGWGHGRPAATIVLVALIPVATRVPRSWPWGSSPPCAPGSSRMRRCATRTRAPGSAATVAPSPRRRFAGSRRPAGDIPRRIERLYEAGRTTLYRRWVTPWPSTTRIGPSSSIGGRAGSAMSFVPTPRSTGTMSMPISSRRPASSACLAICPPFTATSRSPASSFALATAASMPSVTNTKFSSACGRSSGSRCVRTTVVTPSG